MLRLRYFQFIFATTCFLSSVQAGTLTTVFSSNDSQAGNMFDIKVTNPNPLLVTQLALNLADTFQGTIEIYRKSGTWVGFDTNAAAWTLVDTLNNVVSAGSDNPTLIDPVDFLLPGNATTALYITDTQGFNIQYSTGGTVGAVAASNADLQILVGAGKSYPFGSTFTPRTWNGTIDYQVDPTAAPEPSSMALMAFGGMGLIWRRRRSS